MIISSSGMMDAGRIVHHLKYRLPNAANTVVLGGFMAVGTRGRLLQDGAKSLRMHGQEVPVRAAIEKIPGLSGHADRSGLLRWLEPLAAPKQVFLVHGEPQSAEVTRPRRSAPTAAGTSRSPPSARCMSWRNVRQACQLAAASRCSDLTLELLPLLVEGPRWRKDAARNRAGEGFPLFPLIETIRLRGRDVRHGGQVAIEVLAPTRFRFTAQIVHRQHDREFLAPALARNWLTEYPSLAASASMLFLRDSGNWMVSMLMFSSVSDSRTLAA